MVKRSLPVDMADKNESPASEKAERRKYEVEDAMRTVQRAEEIKKDRAMMKDVKAMAKQKIKELGKIC
jgi:hypothetical protein